MAIEDIDSSRLERNLDALCKIGKNRDGGIDRQLATPADLQAREWLRAYWEQMGLTVHSDAVANLYAVLPGREPGLAPIAVGSHHDTVPNGGKYDGAMGVLLATELAQSLQDAGTALRHPLCVCSFTGEEPSDYGVSTFGSKVLAGRLGSADLMRQRHAVTGETLAAAVARLGGEPGAADQNRLRPGDWACFIECHNELGRVLFDEGLAVGVVDCITGIYRETVEVTGTPNHAGTTQMPHRRDALLAASLFALEFEALLRAYDDPQLVGTIGHIEVWPNASNIIPGRVVMALEMRCCDPALRADVLQKMEAMTRRVADQRGVHIHRRLVLDQAETQMSPLVQKALLAASAQCGQPERVMASMAGHDAANIARSTPAGMLFTQSVDGLGHCPQEYTRAEDIYTAGRVLLAAVQRLDEELDR